MSKSCVFCVALALCATGCGARLSAGDAKALADAKAFLAGGGDINARDEDDWTLMRHAVWNNHPGTMRYLISNGTNLRELCPVGYRAGFCLLHMAALRGHLEAMKILVEHGAEIDASIIGYTALHLAAWEGSVDTVKFLVRHKANVNAKGTLGNHTPIFFAAAGGSYEVVEFLISRGVSATTGGKWGARPLWVAGGGRWPVIRALSERLFCLDPMGSQKKNIVIKPSSLREGNHGKVVRLLVKNGAKVNRFIGQTTPLHEACFAGNLRAAEVLLELGADPSVRTGDELFPDLWRRPGYNALDCGVWGGLRCNRERGGKLVEALIRAGAKVNQHDGTGKTPLHHAVENLHLDAIKTLLKAGANVNGVDKKFVPKDMAEAIVLEPPWYRHNIGTVHYGQTPLFTALKIDFSDYWDEEHRSQMREKRTEVIKLLLDKGADTAVQLSDGATPLHIAVLYSNPEEIIDLLLGYGADINATDKGLATPLHYAAARDRNDDEQHEIDMLGLARLLVSKGASLTVRAKTRNMTPLEWALWSKDSGEAKTEMSKEFARILTDPNAGQ
ncbi:MAG: ankyrin repeat domain-containing protein [Phycisphaerae bacterium]|nr:ankyrin repeat domain-containing protein [Phycisphaerae bacterium]